MTTLQPLRMGALLDSFLTGGVDVSFKVWHPSTADLYKPGDVVLCHYGNEGHTYATALIQGIEGVPVHNGKALLSADDWQRAGFDLLAGHDLQKALVMWLSIGGDLIHGFGLYRVTLKLLDLQPIGSNYLAALETSCPGWRDRRKSLEDAVREAELVN